MTLTSDEYFAFDRTALLKKFQTRPKRGNLLSLLLLFDIIFLLNTNVFKHNIITFTLFPYVCLHDTVCCIIYELDYISNEKDQRRSQDEVGS